jgi:tetratricopeptide (TPR) repeat protein
MAEDNSKLKNPAFVPENELERGLFGELSSDELLPRSEKLESIMSGLATWTADERSRYCDEATESPLLIPKLSDSALSSNEIAQAVMNTAYDDIDTPWALATESKRKGNDAFTKGKEWYPNAIRHYNDAIGHAKKALNDPGLERPKKREMRQLESTCLSNLAAIYLARGKHITVVDSCERALRLWPDNVKAAFRAAKSCLALGRATTALGFCEVGRMASANSSSFPDNSTSDPFEPISKEATELLQRQERIAAKTKLELANRAKQLEKVRSACLSRGLRVGPPLYSGGMRRTLAMPYVDKENDLLHWPLLLLYPQYNTSDFLEDVCETATIADIISHVFPPDSRAGWDVNGEYAESNVDVFFKTNACKPLPSEEWWTRTAEDKEPEETWLTQRMVRVPQNAPLLLPLLQPSYVIADTPLFYVVARSSQCWADMKKRAGGGEFIELVLPKELVIE